MAGVFISGRTSDEWSDIDNKDRRIVEADAADTYTQKALNGSGMPAELGYNIFPFVYGEVGL